MRWRITPSAIYLASILAFGVAVRLSSFQGYLGLDDGEYARFAHQLAHDSFQAAGYTGPAVFPLRIGVIAPAAAAFAVFGSSEWSLVVYPLVMSLLGIALMYACGSLLFGWRAGAIGATLLALFPWDIESATILLADMPAAVFAAAAVTALIFVDRREENRRSALFSWGVVAGLAFGFSWLCKESVAYLAPFCAIWAILMLRRHGAKALHLWAGVAVGSLAILLGEMAVYHAQTGDLLFRFHEIERNYLQWENSFFTEGSDFGWQRGESYAEALKRRLLVTGPTMIFLSRTFFYLPLICVGVTVYALFRRDRSFLVPAIWLWTLVLMFNFASSSSTTYTPLALFHRYLYPIFFPSILLAAGFVSTTAFSAGQGGTSGRVRAVRWSGILVGSFIAWMAVSETWLRLRYPVNWMADVHPAQSHVSPETVLYSDALTLRAFEFFARYPERTSWTDLQSVRSPSEMRAGSLVLIYPAGIEWLDRNAGMWVAWPDPRPTDRTGYLRGHFSLTPPGDWAPIWQQGDVVLYRVGGSGEYILPTGGEQ